MSKHLVAIDFDGTMFRTFEDSPNGMNVNLASRYAVRDVFGETGLRRYQEVGELQGREPGEIVSLVLEGMSQTSSHAVATEQYVESKLSYLAKEISTSWPRPTPGVGEFFKSASRGEIPVDLAVVSSGHDEPIKKILEVNEMNAAIIVTSDLLRAREVHGKFKPHPYQLAEAHRQWRRVNLDGQLMSGGVPGQFIGRWQLKPNMLYVGDDPVKDGKMAEISRIPFVFMPFTKDDFTPQLSTGQIYLSDFHALRKILLKQAKNLEGGASFVEVLFGKGDWEIFSRVPEGERPWARMMRERSI